ncbi:Chlorophyllase [Sesbania bispinosa]|nr:Chlorophyllase [Sesbania bispinosa]
MCSHASNVFDTGNYTTQLQRVESSSCTHNVPPPKSLLIATPVEAGEFSLVLFLHGYLLYNSFYSQLIQHVASHGFIVIAPQNVYMIRIRVLSISVVPQNSSIGNSLIILYTVAGPDTSDEIHSAAAITNWLSEGLCKFLPPNVKPNFGKLALGGHSRGGKTAFALALRKLNITTNLKFSALIGVDPVDGMERGKQTPPPVLTYVPHSFDFDMAAMVIGSGLGEMKRNPLFPPCAPKGVNHEDFFNECNKPAWYFVAKDYGHADMLDDDTMGVRGKATYCLCKNGESRKPMRKFVGGVIVAFLKAYLHADNEDLLAIRDRHVNVPLEFKFDYFV